jgi:hypothetical protein
MIFMTAFGAILVSIMIGLLVMIYWPSPRDRAKGKP